MANPSNTTIIKCNCESDFQDKTYGKGNRLHNISKNRDKAYCTVCSESSVRNKVLKTIDANRTLGMVIPWIARNLNKGIKTGKF